MLTICQRHLAAGHVVLRKTTPTGLRLHTTANVSTTRRNEGPR